MHWAVLNGHLSTVEALLRAGARASPYDASPVTTIRGVLSPDEVRLVHAAAAELQLHQPPLDYDATLRPADELPFGLKPPHQSLFLHEGAFLMKRHPNRHAPGAKMDTRAWWKLVKHLV